MKIYNGFSQTPTRNFTAAGIDFFIPNIDDTNVEQVNVAIDALCASYKINVEDIERLYVEALNVVNNETLKELIRRNKYNLVHLYYGLKDKVRNIDMKD